MSEDFWKDDEEFDAAVLAAIEQAMPWVGPIPAQALCGEDPRLPSEGDDKDLLKSLRRLHKKGLITLEVLP